MDWVVYRLVLGHRYKDVDETDVSDFYFRLADEGLNDYRDRAGTGLMAKDILLPTVDNDDDGGWGAISDDADKPLTEKKRRLERE